MKKRVIVYLPEAEIGMEQQGVPTDPNMQQAPEGQMPPEGMPPQGGQDPQMEALMQEVASMIEQGADPATIIGGLLQSGIPPEIVMQIVIQTGIAPDEQTASQMIQETMASMQQGGAEGQQAPAPEGGQAPQEMMQPPMALGGETAMNEKIAHLAELMGASEQEISDQITAAIEQSGDASAVEAKLDQAIAQLEQQSQQAGQPQGMGQGMPQGGSAPQGENMSPGMRYGGPTPKDFRELEREMINQYRKGGTSKGEFDTSNTQSYVENLKGAVSNWVSTNNKIGLVRQRTENNLALFDELPEDGSMLPKAKGGMDIDAITDEADKKYYTEAKERLKDYATADFATLNKAYSEGKVNEGDFQLAMNIYGIEKPKDASNTSTNTNATTTTTTDPNAGTTTSNAMQGETYAQWATRNKVPYGGQYSDAIWDGTKWVQSEGSGAKHYYPGYGPGTSLSGKNVPTNSLLQSIESLTGAIGPKTPTGNLQVKGVEGLAGKSKEDVMKRFQEVLADPTKFQYAVKDVRRKNIFGKEKKGDRNIIGKQILWSPTTGQPVSTDQSAGTTNTPTTTGPLNWNDVDDNKDNIPDYLQPQTNNASTVENNTNVPPKVNEAQMLKDLTSNDRWTRKTAEEYFAQQDKETTPRVYTDEELVKLYGKDTKQYKQAVKDQEKLLEKNPNLRVPSGSASEPEVNTDGVNPNQNPPVEIKADLIKYAEQLGVTPEELQDEFMRNAVIESQKAWMDPRSATGTYYPNPNSPFNQPEPTMARGGELTGGIIWDFENKRFTRRPALMTAAKGMETTDQFGMNILPEMSRDIQWGEMADSIYGAGSWLNQKMDLLRKLTSSSDAADERQAMFKAISAGYSSGQKGKYTQSGDWIPNDVSAKMLPGTGTDQSVFTDGYQRNFYKDMNPGGAPLMTRNGGLYAGPLRYAENGLEVDQEYDLSDEDIAQLQALGYKIERL